MQARPRVRHGTPTLTLFIAQCPMPNAQCRPDLVYDTETTDTGTPISNYKSNGATSGFEMCLLVAAFDL